MDAQLGRVLAFLDETNRAPDTIIVFASDNGPVTSDWINWYEVNAYGSTGGLKGRKHFLHEGGIKVPAIIRYPSRLPAGIQSNQLMTGTDWFATLLSLAGVAPPRDRPIDSVDMGFAADQPKPPALRILHWALPTPDALDFAVREGSFKLLIDRKGVPRELFNLQEDPLELFNLVEVEPVITARLLAHHHDVLTRINADPLLRRPTAPDS
jgi:arylsulfatase A-like enzyme